MALPRFFGLIDIGVAVVAAVVILLPPREMQAQPAIKGDEFEVALAEARTLARPGDGAAAEDFTRKLGDAGMKDWAVETAVRLADRAKDSPTRWRALIAASVAYIEKVDAVPALEYANKAIEACQAVQKIDPAACPAFEEVRLSFYQQHLDAGVKSGIDPKTDPAGFRRAGQNKLRQIYIGPNRPVTHGSAAGSDTPAAGSAETAP
jgi:hypothetical protein